MQRCIGLLLICQTMLCVVARGQTFVPSQSLTIPPDSTSAASDDVSRVTSDFVITVRTDLLGEFVKRVTVRSNNVATQVMEAAVRGIQTTTTSIRLSSSHSEDIARLNILAHGVVSSNTVGLTSQAAVTTLGSHTFHITKPVFFDGDRFLTKPAFGSIQARQFPQSVNTVASQLPLIGRIGDRIAWNEVLRRMPASDAIVVRRVADDVIPQVNDGVDQELARLNRSWRSWRRTLDSLSGTDRIHWSAASTSTSYSTSAHNTSLRSRSQKRGKLNADLASSESFVLLLSEEGVNRWLGWQPLAGLKVSDGTIQLLIEALKDSPETAQDLLKHPDRLAVDPLLFSVKFVDVDPLALRFEDGAITVRLKFQVIPKIGESGLMQLVTVRLSGQPGEDGMWSISLDKLSAEPASRNAQPDLYTNLMNSPAIFNQVPPTLLPRTIDIRKFHPRMPLFRLQRIQSDSGQLRVSLRVVDTDTVPTAEQ